MIIFIICVKEISDEQFTVTLVLAGGTMLDTVKFIEERNRMCGSFDGSCHDAENQRCPAFKVNKNGLFCAVGKESTMDAKDQIAIVENWSASHPRKTRQSVFIQQNPEVFIYDGVISIKPCQMVQGYTSRYCTCDSSQCLQCRKEYWMKEVESDDYS